MGDLDEQPGPLGERPPVEIHRATGYGKPLRRWRKGNIGKRSEDATGGHATHGSCNVNQKPRSHHTSRIARAKLMARVREEISLECPACGGDIRLIAFRLLEIVLKKTPLG